MQLLQETNYKTVIAEMFPTDKDLIEKYHINADKNATHCVIRTINDLEMADKSFKFFIIKDNESTAAFFGTEFGNYLNTFFIHPSYRKKEVIGKIWNKVSGHFSASFFTALYGKNTRAINFYLKNGGTKVGDFCMNGNSAVLIKFER